MGISRKFCGSADKILFLGRGRGGGGYPYYSSGSGGYRRPFTPPFGRPIPIAIFGG